MSLHRNEEMPVVDTATAEVAIEDAKKGKGKGKAMPKGSKLGSKGVDMQVDPGKNSSVPASSNAAKKASVPKQKLS